jgi:allophanate hydrolase subunit 2
VSGVTAPPARWLGRPPRLRIVFGPRADWFSARALSVLTSTAWIVRSESNRIGLRLDGPTLERVRNEELVSEPSRPGALQVPPDGRPIVLGPDAPVTGGYPVICVVRRADLDIAAQLRPGDAVTFRP